MEEKEEVINPRIFAKILSVTRADWIKNGLLLREAVRKIIGKKRYA